MGTFGIPWNFADAAFEFKTTGDGLNFRFLERPLSPQSFVAWSPPGAMTTQSAMYHAPVNIGGSGNATVITGTSINALAPWNASYLVLQPAATSTVSKTMKGINGDTGINLIPWLPLILALPSPLANTWALVINFGAAEDLDLYLV